MGFSARSIVSVLVLLMHSSHGSYQIPISRVEDLGAPRI